MAASLARIGGEVASVWTHLENAGHSKPAKNLDDWTEKRHKIVHQGKKITVHRPTANDFKEFAIELVNKVDAIAEGLKTLQQGLTKRRS